MIAVLLLGCSGDKTKRIPVDHTGWTESPAGHTATVGDSAHTGFPTCYDVPVLPPDWGPNDDPCGILEGRLFTGTACTQVWFENGWLHYYNEDDISGNKPYQCRSDGPIAYLRACRENSDGPFRFDRRTGLLTLRGFEAYRMTAKDWSNHSGTTLDYYFYRDSGYSPSFCGYPHTGIWSSP